MSGARVVVKSEGAPLPHCVRLVGLWLELALVRCKLEVLCCGTLLYTSGISEVIPSAVLGCSGMRCPQYPLWRTTRASCILVARVRLAPKLFRLGLPTPVWVVAQV